MDYDIAIAGYGPVGETLAALLAGSGLSVVVAERADAPYDKPRAMTGDHEMLRTLQFVGAAEALSHNIRAHEGTTFIGADRRPVMSIDIGPKPYPLGWPTGVQFVQPELEALLRETVRRRGGVDVRLETELAGFREEGERVVLDLAGPGGRAETLRARWLVACDGANSFVRRALGRGDDDLAFDEWWIVVDAWKRGPLGLPERSVQYCFPERPGTLVTGPGDLRRWEIKVLPHEDPESFRDPERVREVLAGFVDVDAIELWRTAVYRFHALVARDWRSGRVLLAGDAAHQMPPFLGQGLCAGVRDAANLAWKLRMIETRGASPALLDSYEAERRPHVARVVALAKERGLIIGELDPEAAAARDARLRAAVAAGELPTVRHAYIPGLSAGLVDQGPGALAAGELFPQPWVRWPDGTEGLLDDRLPPEFLVVSDAPAALAQLDAETVRRLERLGARRVLIAGSEAPPPGDGVTAAVERDGVYARWAAERGARWVLVRPDRYAYGAAREPAAVGRMLETLEAQVFGAASAE